MYTINIYYSVYEVQTLNKFNKQLRKVIKQGRDINKLIYVIGKLANGEKIISKIQRLSTSK